MKITKKQLDEYIIKKVKESLQKEGGPGSGIKGHATNRPENQKSTNKNKVSNKDENKPKYDFDTLKNMPEKQSFTIIKKSVPKISSDEIDTIIDYKQTFNSSERPETYDEMAQAGRMAKEYWKILKRYPDLKQFGFKDEDVYDPRDDF